MSSPDSNETAWTNEAAGHEGGSGRVHGSGAGLVEHHAVGGRLGVPDHERLPRRHPAQRIAN